MKSALTTDTEEKMQQLKEMVSQLELQKKQLRNGQLSPVHTATKEHQQSTNLSMSDEGKSSKDSSLESLCVIELNSFLERDDDKTWLYDPSEHPWPCADVSEAKDPATTTDKLCDISHWCTTGTRLSDLRQEKFPSDGDVATRAPLDGGARAATPPNPDSEASTESSPYGSSVLHSVSRLPSKGASRRSLPNLSRGLNGLGPRPAPAVTRQQATMGAPRSRIATPAAREAFLPNTPSRCAERVAAMNGVLAGARPLRVAGASPCPEPVVLRGRLRNSAIHPSTSNGQEVRDCHALGTAPGFKDGLPGDSSEVGPATAIQNSGTPEKKVRLLASRTAEYLLLAEVAPVAELAELRETSLPRLPRLSKRTAAVSSIRRSKSDKPGKFIDDGNPIPKLRWLQRGLMADRADGGRRAINQTHVQLANRFAPIAKLKGVAKFSLVKLYASQVGSFSSSAHEKGSSGDVRTPSPDWLIATPLSERRLLATSSASVLPFLRLSEVQVFTSELDFAFQRGQTK
ncbi:hypothetical protein HPB47_022416 [Ixodes persulcatus]|uniref:Uncharacterized protein n=1 Tax=Ixodes persulcatus TaxID=34615 RepID=A0AC60QC26_IXOPE|nr:hypothetical protein HPB47_022416 [Ixodes persulcatus]